MPAAAEGYESIYMGSYGPLSPEYGELFIGYRIPVSEIAAPTSIRTGNQIAEVSARLSEGIRAIELQPFAAESGVTATEVMSREQFKEIARLGKLTGAEFSLHMPPTLDPAGFTREGWSEAARAETEAHLKSIIDRAHVLNPKGELPVVIHATSGIPATEWIPGKEKPEVLRMVVANQETGALAVVEREERFLPKEHVITPQHALEERNLTEWNRPLFQISALIRDSMEDLEKSWPIIAPEWKEIAREEKKFDELTPTERTAVAWVETVQTRNREALSALRSLWDRAYRLMPEEKKEEFKEHFDTARKKFEEAYRFVYGVEGYPEVKDPSKAIQVLRELAEGLRKLEPEKNAPIFVPVEDFALKHTKETIANTALYTFQKYGDNGPTLCLENFFAGTVFSRGEELANLIKECRKAFVEKARKAGIPEDTAKRAAEKLIGATWDTGHIHLLRKYGWGIKAGKYSEEEMKRIMAAETKAIAPFVKHTHLSDNFGFEDSHLPPGMGEVPLKEILKELEKAGVKGKKVIEAAAMPVVFKASPTPYVLEALGSPLYAMYMQPFWNQVRGIYGIPAGYWAGYGLMLPEQHFGTYGAGFSTLPAELGGALPRREGWAGAPKA